MPTNPTTQTVILSGCRTPFGKFGGALAALPATELGGMVVAEALRRANILPAEVDHLILGQVLQAGAGQIPSRQAGFRAGLPASVTSETLNRVCASGIRAVTLADVLLRAGEYSVVVAGGMESMSNAPYLLPKGRFGYRLGDGALVDSLVHDGLTCAVAGVHMGVHGGDVAAEAGITREAQDCWALRSHQRAIAAINAQRFAAELVSVAVPGRGGAVTLVERDESPRADTSLEQLAQLQPAFKADATVTAGNAPGINDGAAALVLTSAAWANEHQHQPLARIVAHATAACDVPYLAYAPAVAAERALAKAGYTVADLDLIEINEAFANVTLIAAQRLGLTAADPRLNVNGGAIALGHPIGASGARLVITLAHELHRRGGGRGLAAICSGGAQGDAIIIEVDRR